MQYTTENTEGYSLEDLATLNRIYEHRIALLSEDERENADLRQHVSERVLEDCVWGLEHIPDSIGSRNEGPLRVVRVVDLIPPGDSDTTIALLDLQASDGLNLEGRLVCIECDGSTCMAHGHHDRIRTPEDIATDNQGDWSPVEEPIYEGGRVEFHGRAYGLLQDAYYYGWCETAPGFGFDDAYIASAIEVETGRSARVYWRVRDDYDPEMQDESDACDWDHPDHVEVWDE